MSGIRTSISVAFVMIFVSELAGASSGLGYQMSVSQLSYRMDQMMAILFIFGIIGALTDFLFVNLTKITFPWIKNLNK
jgi:ABC-type nitrate/sulfonate/bicarbonate transport system permease component